MVDKKEIFELYKEEMAIADGISAIENVELKQYHLGRASVYKDLLRKVI